jgi:hypothetical protein
MSELRASDADREQAAERLRAAAGEGRLTAEELEGRLERALTARTEADLEPLVSDLPAPPARRPPPRRARDSEHVRAYLSVSIMLVAIWALTGAGYFWPIWPILGWGIGVVADAGRLGRPCRRRSSKRASSTARWPSSAAAAPGSVEPRR